MPTSVEAQLRQAAHRYVRHGGKKNRRQQIQRLVNACEWIAVHHRISRIEQIGKRQIIDFYRHHRQLAPATLMGYFYAFAELWRWLDRPGEPPRPHIDGQKHEPPQELN